MGSIFPSVGVSASLRDLGKKISSVLDVMASFPTCICMPKRSNSFMRTAVIILSSLRSYVLNTLPSTTKKC